ncbi:hypothetical protein TIFTF001_003761 [Ficus carica]|uniref:Pectinesterase inhibitor domain-containing protein n=1 Tax=Ficus carica TaxID=3494 RepID=A0AA88CW19_FICCA|nr:hypothetical protein TIFTF001_003761 [Ficus carica]
MDMLKVSGLLHVLVALLILQLCSHKDPSCSAATTTFLNNKTYVNYIKTSCNVTTYPKLCYRSLSDFANEIKTSPKVLAHTALNVSLAATRKTSKVLNRLSKTQGLNLTELAALHDCIELIYDSSYELRRCMIEIHRLRSENFAFGISNILTWASAALTNSVTCMDGFGGNYGKVDQNGDDQVKNTVLRHEEKVCRLTSNSLALVNSYASSQG